MNCYWAYAMRISLNHFMKRNIVGGKRTLNKSIAHINTYQFK